MIPLLTREAVRGLDRDAAERLGLPTIVLMENAGRGAFDAIVARFGACLANVVVVVPLQPTPQSSWRFSPTAFFRQVRASVAVTPPAVFTSQIHVGLHACAPTAACQRLVERTRPYHGRWPDR